MPGESFDIAAAVTNLFVQHNRMHDWAYCLGFTEENWNAQTSNFGITEAFRENDPCSAARRPARPCRRPSATRRRATTRT